MPTTLGFDLRLQRSAPTKHGIARVLTAVALLATASACSGEPDETDEEQKPRLEILFGDMEFRVGAAMVPGVRRIAPPADPVDIDPAEVEWATSDENVVVVDGSMLIAIAAGQAEITATHEGLTATATLAVLERLPTITVDPPAVVLPRAGATASLSPSAHAEDGTLLEDDPSQFTYESSDEEVATVSASGVVTAHGLGEATVFVRYGEAATSVWVQVKRTMVAVGFAENPVHLDFVGHRVSLQPVGLDEANEEMEPLEDLTWESSDEDVVVVDGFGRVTAVNDGTATVTGNWREPGSETTFSGEATIIVRQKAARLVVSHSSLEFTRVGDTAQLSAQAWDEAEVSIPLALTDLTWSSDDSDVATVNDAGLVSAVRRGTTVVRVQRDERTVEVPVTVIQVPSDVEVTPMTVQLDWLGQTGTLVAAVRDQSGDPIEAQPEDFTWSSSNTSVATVDGAGVVTAVGAGTALIYAKFESVQSTAGVTVTQVPTWFAMSPDEAILEVGQTFTPSFEAKDAGGSALVLSGTSLSWESSDESVVTVSAEGVITAVGAGSTSVRVTLGDLTRVIDLLVPDGPEWWVTFDWKTESPFVEADWATVFVSGEWTFLSGDYQIVWNDELRDGSGFRSDALAALGGMFAPVDAWISDDMAVVLESHAVHAMSPESEGWQTVYASATRLRALDVQGENLLIVGDDGLILTAGEDAPGPMDVPVSSDIVAVDLVSDSAAWAATANGEVLFFDGDFWDVWANHAMIPVGIREGTDGVVYVAGNTAGGAPLLQRLVAGTWSASSFPNAAQLTSFDVTTDGRVFLTTLTGEIIEWFDGSWSTPVRARHPLSRVRADESGRAVAVGANGTVLVFDGERWSTASGNRGTLRAVFAPSRDALFAAGDLGTFLARKGDRWHDVRSDVDSDFHSVWAASGTDVWAVGANGTVARYDGETLTAVASPTTETLRAVWGTASDDVWIAGDFGALYRWNGSSWTRVNAAESRSYLAATGGADSLRFAGTGGLVVDSAGAAISSDLVDATYTSLASFPTGEFFAYSSEGHLLSWEGGALQTKQSIPGGLEGKLWGRTATDLFVLVQYDDSTTGLSRYDGETLTTVTAPGGVPRMDARYEALCGVGNQLVLVGEGGQVLVGTR